MVTTTTSPIQHLWTLTSPLPPAVLRSCRRCHRERPFDSSGKFRLNANGRRLDAWLIYRCRRCGATWNLPVEDRVRPRDLAPAVLRGYQSTCPTLASQVARRRSLLERFGRLEAPQEVEIAVSGAVEGRCDVVIDNAGQVRWRLDRVVAHALGTTRSEVGRLAAGGQLAVLGEVRTAKALRRSVQHRQRLAFR